VPPNLLPPADVRALTRSAVAGDRRSFARVLTLIERGGAVADAVTAELHDEAVVPYTVGLTGAPGAGKSTLTDALVAEIRAHGERVAVLAVDPASPFTGGAILGDRVRLRAEHVGDDDVFMRSLSNRGHLGGLSRAVPDVVRAFGACGWPTVLIETVGVGQVEVDIAGQADTTVVVVNPGWGDEVQANKAGLLEVADVLVVNKADRDGASAAVRDLRQMLTLAPADAWTPPVVTTVATDGEGVSEAWVRILSHRDHVVSSGELDRRRVARLETELHTRALRVVSQALRQAQRTDDGNRLLEQLRNGDVAPSTASEQLIAQMCASRDSNG
jgi:LAO/AO transport system kinase